MKQKKEIKGINYNYDEEFITYMQKPTEEKLRELFNKKYFNLIKRIEKRDFEGVGFEKNT